MCGHGPVGPREDECVLWCQASAAQGLYFVLYYLSDTDFKNSVFMLQEYL